MTQVRRWILAVSLGLTLTAFPQASHAAIFSFDGVGDLGGVVWDGDADVGTMNNPACKAADPGPPAVEATCETDVFVASQMSLADLELFIFGGLNRADFTTLDIAFTVGDCVPFVGFGTCDLLDAQVPNPANVDLNGNLVDVTQILRLPFGFLVGPGSGYLLQDVETLELAGLSALLDGSHFGVLLEATQSGLDFCLEVRTGVGGGPSCEAAAAAPEPASLLLVSFGLAGAVASRTRRRSKAARS